MIHQELAKTSAATSPDLGQVMNWLKRRLAGRTDMSAVSAQVKVALG